MTSLWESLAPLIEKAKDYWWDGSPDPEYFPLAVEIGNLVMTHEDELREALESRRA